MVRRCLCLDEHRLNTSDKVATTEIISADLRISDLQTHSRFALKINFEKAILVPAPESINPNRLNKTC